jgi:hypothetical protein
LNWKNEEGTMDNTVKPAGEKKESCCCCCTVLLGALVIVFAWWKVSWAAVALTVLGGVVIIKGLIPKCCCKSGICEIKAEAPK